MNPTIKAIIESIRRGEVPEGYKRTKIGIVPNEWGISKIGSVSERIIPGATPSTSVKKYWDGNIRWMSSGEIHNRFIYNTKSNITKEGYEVCSTTILPTHCVLIALAGQGKTRGCVAVNEVQLCTNQSIAALVPKDIYYLYLFFYLESKYLELRKISSGDGTRGGLNISLLNGFQIAVPAHPEQEKIAEILAGQDRVIALKEKLLAKKQKQKKYLMQQLLAGKKRLPGFSGEWKKSLLGDLFRERVETNCTELRLLAITGGQGVIPRDELELKDNSSEDKSKYKKICVGDIGYNTMRMWQGVSAFSNYEGIVSPAYTILMPNSEIDAKFFAYLFKLPSIIFLSYRYSQGLVDDTRNLKYENLKRIRVLFPQDKKEQVAIAEILSTADKEIELLKKDIEQEKLKKKSLMQLLLTGIVRVKDV